MITIVDYGLGNQNSILNMLHRIGIPSIIANSKEELKSAQKIILPGVGAFDNGIRNLRDMNLFDILDYKVKTEKVPILGICLGVQLFTRKSQEGTLAGFGWIPADTYRIVFDDPQTTLKIPHMGWNSVEIVKDSPLCDNFTEEMRFYFVHSYRIICDNASDVLMNTTYGTIITAAINHENIYGTQFHPEKSHAYGMKLLKNFAEL